jgi:hypothetical protein
MLELRGHLLLAEQAALVIHSKRQLEGQEVQLELEALGRPLVQPLAVAVGADLLHLGVMVALLEKKLPSQH